MTNAAYIAGAVVVLLLCLWLVWLRHRDRKALSPAPFPPEVTRKFHIDDATAYASRRIKRCGGLDSDTLRRLVDWCAGYIASQSRPMNGGGPRDGWLVPPNVFDIVAHLRREADAVHIDVDDECLWEVVNLHDEYLRSLL